MNFSRHLPVDLQGDWELMKKQKLGGNQDGSEEGTVSSRNTTRRRPSAMTSPAREKVGRHQSGMHYMTAIIGITINIRAVLDGQR